MTARTINASELTVDLSCLRDNYQLILDKLAGVPVAAMVKADAYGLGAVPVSQALWAQGCRSFFVAQVDEGVSVRACVPQAEIHVLNGAMPGTLTDLREHGLIPVLNSLEQIVLWRDEVGSTGEPLRAAIHFDTGMNRLGLSREETQILLADLSLLEGLDVHHVMSHLVSAEVVESDQSDEQLVRFGEVRRVFPDATASLANSAGIFRGSEFHFDLARPGIALYGGSPIPGAPNPMGPVVTVEVPLLQVNNVQAGDTVGYGSTHTVTGPRRLGTIGAGYADGFLRSGSNAASVSVMGTLVPVVGRVSMDLVTIDVTDVPENDLYLGAPVELIGVHCLVDDVAERAGTIPNEILTQLGNRYRRQYVGGNA